jgi:pimeloyl-ACP methyl ester carboxylesterase
MVTLVSFLGFGCSSSNQNKLHREVYRQTGIEPILIDIDRRGIDNIKDYSDKIYSRIEKFPSPMIFLGYSLGGAVAFEMAKRLSLERVKEIFAIAPLSNTKYGFKEFIYKGLCLGSEEILKHPFLIASIAKNIFQYPNASRKFIEDIANYEMPEVYVPTTVILSSQDRFFNIRTFNSRPLRKLKAIYEVPGNHLIHLTDPKATVACITETIKQEYNLRRIILPFPQLSLSQRVA